MKFHKIIRFLLHIQEVLCYNTIISKTIVTDVYSLNCGNTYDLKSRDVFAEAELNLAIEIKSQK